jgi:transcriptional regulator with XRE-family HTH domain
MARGPAHSARRVLAANLRRLRLARDLSQDELADSAGVRQALVSAIEVGTANPTLNSLESLALALGVTVGELLIGVGKQR